ncbi:ABC transporter ATP-binding protein [Streptomyces brasiliensis]|uniref:Peptide ABC transporter ATP-binding protein n=1 Tax=Streptomyces brasiliensis TaxID=1954 RepID=A0A917PD71_9ACTN|nr:oligopeptide/dipeptide ABC transporter ATP-binding protein [Streptomyces brasiliensis]GGJ71310.1 peptide ABC transporter ATP-binding protein [Streptomyces brasiliensis]
MTSIESSASPMMSVKNLSVHFSRGRRKALLRAVDDVSFTVENQQTVGIVGESGSGKTTLGRAILGLTPIAAGNVEWLGEDITVASRSRRRDLSADLGVVFQDPYSSLNPTRTIGQTLREMLHTSSNLSRQEMDARVGTMLKRVGLAADAAARYPSNFSGGQRQRIAIARALVVQPRLVICDEAVTALDLSVQAQVLNLLRELQRDFHLSYLFIAHDLDVVRYIADRILVFYRGQVVEEGPAEELYFRPLHPYTRALLEAVPIPDPTVRRATRASAKNQEEFDAAPVPETGCPFAPRCPYRTDVCVRERPVIESCRDGRFRVACHHWRQLDGAAAPVSGVNGRSQRW